MKDFQHEQLFTELTPAEAAVVEGGRFSTYFSQKVPSIGPTTPVRLATSNDISIQMSQNPYDLKLKVAQFGKRDVIIQIPANSRKVYPIPADVHTTGFNLSFDAPTTDLSFDIAGRITS